MRVIDVEQGTEEWAKQRLGFPTGSGFSRIFTAAKAELSKQRFGYMDDLIAEKFFPEGSGTEFGGSGWTNRGHELEPEARAAYTALTGNEVHQTGIIVRDNCICRVSPDGMLTVRTKRKWDAGLEIKCPAPKTHIKYFREQRLPDEYKQQVHGGMVIAGVKRWDFFSYCPGLKPLHLIVNWDGYTEKLAEGLDVFVKEYVDTWNSVVPKIQMPESGE